MANVQRGLERVSAVWWGWWGLLAGILLVSVLFKWEVSDRWEIVGIGLGGVIGAYVAHRVTCWILAGFFSPRP